MTFFYGDNTRTGRTTVGVTHGTANGRRVVAFRGSFRNEAFNSVSTAKRSGVGINFNSTIPRFRCTIFGSLGDIGTLIARGATTIVLRLIRKRSNILPTRRSFIATLTSCYRGGNLLLVVSRMRANVKQANGLCTFRRCNVRPSVFALTGNLTGKIPINTVLTGGRFNDTFNPNSRNSAFNNGGLTVTTDSTILSVVAGTNFLRRT